MLYNCVLRFVHAFFFFSQLVFQGLWTKETHPKDFPTSLWLMHFSDVLGASHEKNFTFWGEGQVATDGFRQLAEWGSVGWLERELRAKVPALRHQPAPIG